MSESRHTDLVALEREYQKLSPRRRWFADRSAFIAFGLALGILVGRALIWSPTASTVERPEPAPVATACPFAVTTADLERDWSATADGRRAFAESYVADPAARASAHAEALDLVDVMASELLRADVNRFDADIRGARDLLAGAFAALDRGDAAQFVVLEDRYERMLFPAIEAFGRVECGR